MIGNDELAATATNYQRFARLEARGRSPLYEEFTEGVANDPEVLSLLATLPGPKRQPNLLLGVTRYLFQLAPDYRGFRRLVIDNWSEISSAALTMRTQTNEVARCATLLPLLLALPQPLALFEVGTSAGLCLLADRYRYDFGEGAFGPGDSPLTLRCDLRGFGDERPRVLPEVVWRKGIDLNPIDVRDEQATRWLEALVWPGEGDRLGRLKTALNIARADPPEVIQADLRVGLGEFVASAPSHATLAIFHTAVLTYVPPEDRPAFVAEVKGLGAEWISNEGAGVLALDKASVDDAERHEHAADFLMSRNGVPIAWTDPHGTRVQWRITGEFGLSRP